MGGIGVSPVCSNRVEFHDFPITGETPVFPWAVARMSQLNGIGTTAGFLKPVGVYRRVRAPSVAVQISYEELHRTSPVTG